MAVYTELSQNEIQDFLRAYNLPLLLKAEGIKAGVENTNYLLEFTDRSKLILTIFEKRVNENELPFFINLMDLLANYIPSPTPIRTQNGEIITRVKEKPATLVSFLQGKSVTNIITKNMSELGKYMAKMHLAGQNYAVTRKNNLSIVGWEELLTKINGRADEISAGLTDELSDELKEISANWVSDLPRGIIHADLFPDNVFFNSDNNLTGIIDFYFACNDFLVYDLAICLNAWCFEKDLQFNITKAKAMLRAYNEVRPLSEIELAAMPILARGAALRFLLTRSYDWLFPANGALVTPKNPLEYLSKLRFHRKVKHHSEYGL